MISKLPRSQWLAQAPPWRSGKARRSACPSLPCLSPWRCWLLSNWRIRQRRSLSAARHTPARAAHCNTRGKWFSQSCAFRRLEICHDGGGYRVCSTSILKRETATDRFSDYDKFNILLTDLELEGRKFCSRGVYMQLEFGSQLHCIACSAKHVQIL